MMNKRILLSIIVCGLAAASPFAQSLQLTLQECLQSARQNNIVLQNAALDIQAAREQKAEAFTKYFPQISANVMAFKAFDEMVKADGIVPQEIAMLAPQMAQMVGTPYDIQEFDRMYTASLAAMFPLYAGGQITAGNRLAALQTEVMNLQQQLTEQDVLQKVTENFWQIAQLRANQGTLSAAEKQLQAVLQQVEQYVQAGVTTRNDLLKVQLQQQQLAKNRLTLEHAEHILLLLLAQQIGRAGQAIDIVVPPTDALLQDPASLVVSATQAVEGRTELALVSKGVEASRLQLKQERGKYLPTVAVGAMGFHYGMGGFSDDAKKYMNTSATNGLALATVSVPITDWWGGSHALKRKRIAIEQAQNRLRDTQQQLVIDTEMAWTRLDEAYRQISISQSSVEQSQENLRMALAAYEAGSESLTDLLDAETLHRQCQNDLAKDIAEYQIRKSDYLRKVVATEP